MPQIGKGRNSAKHIQDAVKWHDKRALIALNGHSNRGLFAMKTQKKTRTRGVRLNRPQDVRRLLSRLVNETIQGKRDNDTLRACTYACTAILKCFEVGEMEERLTKLETKTLNGRCSGC